MGSKSAPLRHARKNVVMAASRLEPGDSIMRLDTLEHIHQIDQKLGKLFIYTVGWSSPVIVSPNDYVKCRVWRTLEDAS